MFADPSQILRQLGLRENMIVADLGAGTGHYSIAAAHLVPNGKVYAVEVQKEFLSAVTAKAKEARVKNVEAIWGNVEKLGGTKLKDHITDAVIASSILFQVEDRNGFIAEIKRILKPGGELMLIDWSDSSDMVSRAHGIINKNEARKMFEESGFKWQRDINAGAHHYGMILVRL